MKKTALKTAGAIFLLMAFVHFLRFLFYVEVSVNGHVLPVWTSVAGGLVGVALSIWMFREAL